MDERKWFGITSVENLDMRVDRRTGELYVYACNPDYSVVVRATADEARQIRDALNRAYPWK